MNQKATVYNFDGKIKMAVFAGLKTSHIEDSNWSLQGFLNHNSERLVKVLYFKGATIESDVYHVFYK